MTRRNRLEMIVQLNQMSQSANARDKQRIRSIISALRSESATDPSVRDVIDLVNISDELLTVAFSSGGFASSLLYLILTGVTWDTLAKLGLLPVGVFGGVALAKIAASHRLYSLFALMIRSNRIDFPDLEDEDEEDEEDRRLIQTPDGGRRLTGRFYTFSTRELWILNSYRLGETVVRDELILKGFRKLKKKPYGKETNFQLILLELKHRGWIDQDNTWINSPTAQTRPIVTPPGDDGRRTTTEDDEHEDLTV